MQEPGSLGAWFTASFFSLDSSVLKESISRNPSLTLNVGLELSGFMGDVQVFEYLTYY